MQIKVAMSLLGDNLLGLINNFCENGMEDSLKTARVIPLLKKGDRTCLNNYRPVSNLSVFSKVYEKCLLKRLDDETLGWEGDHQHAYRKGHSTETALLTVQSFIANVLENNQIGILYSIDLSAAFDLLRPDTFFKLFQNKLTEGLLFAIMDFLTNQKFVVEVSGKRSEMKELDRGCVQGSILGPKLFTLYMSQLTEQLGDAKVVTYADDTYVVTTSSNKHELLQKTKLCFSNHVQYLKQVGMVVNQLKTEVLWIGKDDPETSVELNGNVLEVADNIKALGVFINGKLNWDRQAEHAISKGRKVMYNFKFLRKYLTKDQFLKAASAHFYGTVFYASSVWFDQCKEIYKRQLDSLHYRLLRTACRDYNYSKSRVELTRVCKRATPSEWSRFATATRVVKTLRDKQPKVLADLLDKTLFEEPRKPGVGKFYDGSRTKYGRQSMQNRLAMINDLGEPWLRRELSDDEIRRMMKRAYFNYMKKTD